MKCRAGICSIHYLKKKCLWRNGDGDIIVYGHIVLCYQEKTGNIILKVDVAAMLFIYALDKIEMDDIDSGEKVQINLDSRFSQECSLTQFQFAQLLITPISENSNSSSKAVNLSVYNIPKYPADLQDIQLIAERFIPSLL